MSKKEQRNIESNKSIWNKYSRDVQGYNTKDRFFTEQLFNDKNTTYFDQERPDFIVENGEFNIVFGIEHFEYSNSSQINNGGSINSKKASETRKLHHSREVEQLEDLKSGEIIQTVESYKINASINNLYENFKKSFLNHYQKREKYIDTLKKYGNNDTEYKVGFLVEDNSPLGLVRKIDFNEIFAYEIVEIINLVVKAESLDFIIFVNIYSDVSIIFVKENIQETIKNMNLFTIENVDIADMEIYDIHSTIKI